MPNEVGFQRIEIATDGYAIRASAKSGKSIATADEEIVGDHAVGLRGDKRLAVELH
jgi:hypothetical protein